MQLHQIKEKTAKLKSNQAWVEYQKILQVKIQEQKSKLCYDLTLGKEEKVHPSEIHQRLLSVYEELLDIETFLSKNSEESNVVVIE